MGKLGNVPVIHHFSHEHPLQLSSCQQTHMISSSCAGCKLTLSGWIYSCRLCNFSLHVPCSQAPQLIHHPADPNHALPLLPRPPYPEGYFNCDACGNRGSGFCYHCSSCNLDFHILCAAMPLSLSHQAHHHTLRLAFFPPYQNEGFSCDVCRGMGSNHWLYRCAMCEFDAHLGCVHGAAAQPKPLVQAPPLPFHVQQHQQPMLQRASAAAPAPVHVHQQHQMLQRAAAAGPPAHVQQQHQMFPRAAAAAAPPPRPAFHVQQQHQMFQWAAAAPASQSNGTAMAPQIRAPTSGYANGPIQQNNYAQGAAGQSNANNGLLRVGIQGLVDGVSQQVGQSLVQLFLGGSAGGGGGGDGGADADSGDAGGGDAGDGGGDW